MFSVSFSSNFDPKGAMARIRKNKHVRELEKLSKMYVYVGFPESAKNEDGLTIAKYAKWNNYGTYTHDEHGTTTSRIPARPFFTEGFFFEKYQERRNKLAKRLVSMITSGKLTSEDACNRIGMQAVSDVRDAISTGPWVPNAPSTMARKLAKSKGKKSSGGVKPLIDTGDMIDSVTYIIDE